MYFHSPPSLRKYKWHPGILPGKILQWYSVRLRIYSWFMKYMPPPWHLRVSSLTFSSDVGRRQQWHNMISPSSHSLHNTHIYMSTKSNRSHSSMSKHIYHNVQFRFQHSNLTKAKYWRAYTGQMTSITSKNLCLTMQPNSLSLFLSLLLLLFPSLIGSVVVAPTVPPPLPRPLPLHVPLALAPLALAHEGNKIVLVDKLIVKQE